MMHNQILSKNARNSDQTSEITPKSALKHTIIRVKSKKIPYTAKEMKKEAKTSGKHLATHKYRPRNTLGFLYMIHFATDGHIEANSELVCWKHRSS